MSSYHRLLIPSTMRTIEAKVVVLGARDVGKTSLVVRYIGKMFNNHISPTIGASFFACKINIEDTRVKLQVWDTAGQERFRSMAPMYYRNANAALLVFDISQHESFDAVKGWVRELQRNVEEPLVLNLVGNKTDLAESRQVSQDEALRYAQNIGASYFESSALRDHGVEEVFVDTAFRIIRLGEEHPLQSSVRIYESTSESSLSSLHSVNKNAQLYKKVDDVVVHTDGALHADPERSFLCC